MKLRLANPEHLIDINDLHELAYIREQDGEIRIGALTRHVDLLEVRAPRRALAAVPRRRERDRRPGRAQPRHDRRLALPGRRGRGPLGRLLGGQGEGRDPRRRRRARRRRWRTSTSGPFTTAVGDGELLTEVRIPLRPGAGSAHEKVERRAGDWAIAAASAAVWIDGGTIADAGIALERGRADDDPPDARRGAAARQGPVRGALRAGGRDRLRGLLPDPRRPRAGRLQAPSRRRPHRTRPAPRDRTRAPAGGLTMHVSITINGEPVSREIEPRQLLVHFIRETPGLTGTHWGCDTSNCGACVVLMDGEPVKSCTTLAAMCEGHEIRTVESLEVDGRLDPVQHGLPRAARAPVRLLHAGDADDGAGAAGREPEPDRAGDPHGDLRGHLPLYRVQEHRRAPSGGLPSTKPPLRDRGSEHGRRPRTFRARRPSGRSASAA